MAIGFQAMHLFIIITPSVRRLGEATGRPHAGTGPLACACGRPPFYLSGQRASYGQPPPSCMEMCEQRHSGGQRAVQVHGLGEQWELPTASSSLLGEQTTMTANSSLQWRAANSDQRAMVTLDEQLHGEQCPPSPSSGFTEQWASGDSRHGRAVGLARAAACATSEGLTRAVACAASGGLARAVGVRCVRGCLTGCGVVQGPPCTQ
ncbi:hypothetical protein Dimus_035574, partial [Dionaea muscipula]